MAPATFLPFILLFLPYSRSQVPETSRVDCHPDPGGNQTSCEARSCIWQPPTGSNSPIGTPSCFYPKESGYRLISQSGNTFTLSPGFPNPFGQNIDNLKVVTGTVGQTLTVSIGTESRYVPPVGFPMNPSTSSENLGFFYNAPTDPFFSFRVVRAAPPTMLWDTSIGGMQFADQFIQIATYLPSPNLFGFGDHVHKKLKHDLSRYTTWPMFARDIPPDSGSELSTQNLYGVHPFYLMIEYSDDAHGVLILNSNAMEVETGPGPHLVYRTIGGQIDLAFFPGPKPEEVIQQYLAYIGTPFLPAYWALGFQLSRWGYGNLTAMQAAVSRTQAAGIPLDIPYADIDYMREDDDFTEGNGWTGFPDYARQLHQEGLHLILIFDPAIEVDYDSFQRALDTNVSFIEWPSKDLVPHNVQDRYPMAKNTLIMLGNVWPVNNTAFPDFLDPTSATGDWWAGEFQRFHANTPFDGIWIDMNEPSNMETLTYTEKESRDAGATTPRLSCPVAGPDSLLDNPPYPTSVVYRPTAAHLCTSTLCMLGRTARRSQNFYDTKSLYGWSESKATYQALRQTTNKRGAVISRSTFPSSGRYAGHWLGDNTARWADLQTSVIGVMEFNFFGIPYVGSDICGFQGPTTEELCLRWHQMGAFHPFSRLHYRASLLGGTVIRPLFFEFPDEPTTQDTSEQFMWGECLMIAPAVKANVLTVEAYFPDAEWYSLVPESYGQIIKRGKQTVDAKKDSLTPVFARGGCILPRQAPNSTTTASRNNPMELLILPMIGSSSSGELYWDAGDDPVDDITTHQRHHWTFQFGITTSTGNITGSCQQCSSNVQINSLDIIEILGYNFYPDFSSFQLNGQKVNVNVQTSSYSPITKRFYISSKNFIQLQQYTSGSFVLTWSHNAV